MLILFHCMTLPLTDDGPLYWAPRRCGRGVVRGSQVAGKCHPIRLVGILLKSFTVLRLNGPWVHRYHVLLLLLLNRLVTGNISYSVMYLFIPR